MIKSYFSVTLTLIVAITLSSTAWAQSPDALKGKKKGPKPADFRLEQLQLQQVPVQSRQAPSPTYKSIPVLHRATNQPGNSIIRPIEIKHEKTSGLPNFIKTKDLRRNIIDLSSPEKVETAALEHLHALGAYMKIEDPRAEFEMLQQNTDQLGQTHVKFQQVYQGVPVYAAEVIVHFGSNNEQLVNGRYQATPKNKNTIPELTPTDAIAKAMQDLQTKTAVRPISPQQRRLLQYDGPQHELVLLPRHQQPGQFDLVWHLTLRPNFLERWEYFVDATNGSIIDQYNHTCSITGSGTDLGGQTRSFEVYNDGGTFYLVDDTRSMFNASASSMPDDPIGAIWTIDARDTDLDDVYQITSGNKDSWQDASSVSAHYHAGLTYEYYKNTHGRESIDGNGGTIISAVNVTSGGSSMENAYWNGQVMAYGNGGSTFKPLAGALDVAAHEMTHGVISKTANLEYKFQPGAINESMADIFGALVDRDDWTMGEEIMQPGAGANALRNLMDPHNGGSDGDWYWQPANMSEFKDLSSWTDHGGVHINSGIPNHAFYFYATAIGKGDAELVYYRALTQYLTRSSEFIDLRIGVVQAAVDLYGNSSTQAQEARNAFDAVEIFDGNGGNYEVDLPVNQGADYILSYDVNDQDANTLYISATDGTGFEALTTTKLKRKPSVTDDGGFGLFVGIDGNIYSIDMNSANPNEQKLTTTGDWDNVAISKDGSKLAAISVYVDTTIYVYDFTLSEWHLFTLYNPTFDSTLTSVGPQYADAVEWDYSGENIVYDAFNTIDANSGQNIEYWDVSFIKVWNSITDKVSDGNITKLFSSIPADVSIGNPVFSKNSPYIIAYDYWDQNSGDVNLQAANIENGDVGTIFTGNGLLGNPCYSKLDDKVVFTAFDQGDTVAAVIDMQSDKINSTGNATALIAFAKWPVWYANGFRVSVEEIAPSVSMPLAVFPNPARDQLQVRYSLPDASTVSIRLYNAMGQTIGQPRVMDQAAGQHTAQLDLKELVAGTYLLQVEANGQVQTIKFVKVEN